MPSQTHIITQLIIGGNWSTGAMMTITGTPHNVCQYCGGTLTFLFFPSMGSDCIANSLYLHIPFETRQQQHWAPDTQSTLRGAQRCHYALQPALEHPTEPLTSQPTSPPLTDLFLHAVPLHCPCRTGRPHRG